MVDVDPVRIAQVVANLLNNAAKYNDKPGHILVSAAREGDEAVVRVLDDGVGIDEDLLPQVFDLFTQADRSVARSQGGLGIGLTLVRSLVERHGGSVAAFSEGPGRGSEFVVRLPALAGPSKSEMEAKTNGGSAAASAAVSRRVLVVDDNADAARSFAEIAALWKHDVRVTYTGAAALELAKSYHPDVVLLDIGLPGMSGYQVARLLRGAAGNCQDDARGDHRLRPGGGPAAVARGGVQLPPRQARRSRRPARRLGGAAGVSGMARPAQSGPLSLRERVRVRAKRDGLKRSDVLARCHCWLVQQCRGAARTGGGRALPREGTAGRASSGTRRRWTMRSRRSAGDPALALTLSRRERGPDSPRRETAANQLGRRVKPRRRCCGVLMTIDSKLRR